jgi:SdiA-regulated
MGRQGRARRRILGALVAILSATLATGPSAHRPAVAAPVVTLEPLAVTDTSTWRRPSPDPTGLTYRSDTGELIVSDAEVDEIGALWSGANLFTASRRGRLVRAGSVRRVSLEPEDVAWYGGTLFVVDDQAKAIFRCSVGHDRRIGTADDRCRRILRTRAFGSRDPEGLAFAGPKRSLFVTDAHGGRVIQVQRGRDGRFGSGDDVVRAFDVASLGVQRPEDVEFDRQTNHLLIVGGRDDVIVETTLRGKLVRTFDISAANLTNASGIALAPGLRAPPGLHIFVIDKGMDNRTDPGENDGRILEFPRTS